MGLALGVALKRYTNVVKRLKLKIRNVLGAKSDVCGSYREKAGRGHFWTSILNSVNITYSPAFQNVSSILQEPQILLKPNKKHKKTFPKVLIIGFRNGKILRDY